MYEYLFRYSFFVGLILCSLSLSAQNSIEWKTWEEVNTLNESNPKKVIVDIYTEWCGWCKKMDKSTFHDPVVVKYVNENYYAVKFDAEYKDDILFKDQIFEFVNQGKRGYHSLASNLTNGVLKYPTIVILDEEQTVIQAIKGFQNPKTFELIITYFGGDHHKTTMWKKYENAYTRSVRPVKN